MAFLLAIAFSPMLLVTGPASAAQDNGVADRALTMDVNGLSSPDEAFVFLGGTLRYKLVATNNGPDTEPNAIVQGQIVPWPATFDRFETTTGTYVDTAGFGTWTIGALAPDESVTLFVFATATTQATNQVATATISGDAVDPDASNNLGEAFFTVLDQPPPDADIEITKSVDNATPGEGDTIVYTLSAANLGPADATNVNVRDEFPADITYVSDDSGGAYDPGTGNWTAGDIANGTTATLRITGTVDAGTAGSTIKNTATLFFLDQNDPNPANDTGVATITVQETSIEADLSVSKTVDDATPAEGATIVYTVIVTNGGPANATGVEISDRLPGGITYVSDDSGGAYDVGSGLWTIGDLANGATATLAITLTVDPGTAGFTIVNDAAVSALDQDDPNQDNDSDTAIITVLGADLSLAKTVDDPTPAERGTIVYTINVTNGGPNNATGVEITDQLPADLTYNADDSGGAYDPVTGVWAIGAIAHGATATLNITAIVNVGTAGDTISNKAAITAAEPVDPNPDNNSDSADIRVVGADLEIIKTVNNLTPGEGDTIVYSLLIINQGPDDTTGVEVWDELPAGVTYVSDNSGGDYDQVTGTWIVGDLTNGDLTVLQITATVDPGTTGTAIVNHAEITETDQDDPDLDNNSDFVGIDVTGSDIGITKTVDDSNPSEGETIVYTLTATNGGPDNATGVAVTDQLPAGVTYVSDDAGGGYNDTTGIWTVGDISNGTFETLRITATVDTGTTGTTITNTATVTAVDQNDPNPGNDTDSADITVIGADLRLVKTVDEPNPAEGDTIVYTVIITSSGPDDATGVAVTDQLPTGVTYVSDDAGGDYNDTTGLWTIGNLDNGAQATLKITATIDTGTTGNTIVNDAEITASDQADPDPTNNTASASLNVAGADLDVTKTVDDQSPSEGDTIVYMLTITNGGPDDTTGVAVTDQLPTGVTYVSDDAGGDYNDTTGIWDIGNLDNGATATIAITATVDTGTTGDTIVNTATITAVDQNDPNPGNDSDSADIRVAGTDLGIVKTVDDPTPVEGQTIVYTIILTNLGPDDATGVEVTDVLPFEVTYVSDDSGGDYDDTTGLWDVGNLDNGVQATLKITATTNPGSARAPIINTATITAVDQNDPNPDNDSDTAGIEITGVDLDVAKTVDAANPAEGDTIVYTIAVTNGGPDDATGVEIADELPAGVTYVSDDSGGDYDDTTGIWDIGEIANGAIVTITITATVDAGTTGSTITNTAAVQALDQIDPNPDNDINSAEITVAGTDLGIVKTVSDPTPDEGDTIIYTIILANHGPDDATGVEVTDLLPSEVSYVSDDAGGDYDDATGLWDVGDLANGSIAVLKITATVNAGTTGSSIINTATITALDQNDPNPGNDTDSAGSIVAGTDLSVTKAVDNANPAEGDTIVYTVHVTNGGPDAATGVEVTDQLPSEVTYVSDDSGGDYDDTTGIWDIGEIANGAIATIEITATVNPGTTGVSFTNTATVTALDQNDPNPDNDTDTATVRVAGTDLAVIKTVSDARPNEGDTIDYNVIVANRGPDDATGIEITDQLPAGVTYVSDDSGGTYIPGTGVWTIGNLDVGNTTDVLTITAIVDSGTVGDVIVNTATITAMDQNDPNPDNNTDDAAITVTGADLSVAKTVDEANPSVGDTIVYTVRLTNGGPDAATGIEVTDQLPAGVTYVSDDSGGSYNPATGLWAVAALANGSTATLSITATVDAGTAGTRITNTATVTTSDQNDPNPDDNTDSADIDVAGADLRILKAVDEHFPNEGETITYSVIVVNGGPDDATGIEVTDQLPAGVTYVSDDTGGSYDPATGIWAVGDVANGEVAVAKILVTVDAGTSDSIIINVASLTAADQDDPNPDNNTDRVTIIVTGADLGLVKTVDNTTPGEDDTVVYSITITNGGPKKATGIEVIDQLPAGVTYVSDDSGATYDPATGIWAVADLANGETATLQITATIDAGTTGLRLTNTAAVTASDQSDPNPDNDTDSADVTVSEPVNKPPSPVEPDDEGNLVPVDNVSDRIALGETPKALDIIDPEGDAFTVVIQTGELPTGVTMDDQGVFSGTATETGTFVLTMETCDDRTPQACSTFTYTLTVDEELPNTGIETTQIAIAGLAALILGALMLIATSRRREEDGQSVAR